MATPPILIIVNGIPGTGKTTLSRKLAADLALPCIGKDDIKELLFGRLGTGDVEFSRDQGAAAAEMLFALVQQWIGRGRSLIAESAYFFTFAAPIMRAVIRQSGAIFIEVYCKTDHAVRKERVVKRAESGERHAGHLDLGREHISDSAADERYAPLRVGKCIEFNTTEFSVSSYRALLKEIRVFLKQTSKEAL